MAFSIVRTPFPTYVHDMDEAEGWAEYFYETAYETGIGFDTETTGLDLVRDRIRFFSVANTGARICAPLRLLPVFVPLLTDPKVEKRMTNAKYDMHMAANHGIIIRGPIPDSMDQDFLYDENRMSHGLKGCAADHLGLRMTPFKQVFGDIGKVDDEVRTMCEVHDILELHDYEGEVEAAQAWALRMSIRLKIVESEDPLLMKMLKKVDLAIKAGCILKARPLLAVARSLGLASKTAGRQGYVSDFVQFLGGPELPNYKERPAWASVMEDKKLIEEAHWLLWDRMLEKLSLDGDPLEELRERVSDYASLDAWASYTLVDWLRHELDDDEMEMVTEGVMEGEEPLTLFDHSEEKRIPFIRTLWNMERRGFAFDAERARAYSVDMRKYLQDVARKVVKVTGSLEFNVGSPKQLREVFFTKDRNGEWVDPFGDPPRKLTSGGASGIKMPSTDKATLETFAGKGNELAELVLRFRQYDKLNGTYMEALPKWADRRGRIHTQLKSIGARTWRLACVDGGTLLETSAGTFPIRDLPEHLDSTTAILTHELRQRRILACFPKGEEEMFEVTLATGESVICTMEHRFLTPSGWKHLSELTEGDEVLRIAKEEE